MQVADGHDPRRLWVARGRIGRRTSGGAGRGGRVARRSAGQAGQEKRSSEQLQGEKLRTGELEKSLQRVTESLATAEAEKAASLAENRELRRELDAANDVIADYAALERRYGLLLKILRKLGG